MRLIGFSVPQEEPSGPSFISLAVFMQSASALVAVLVVSTVLTVNSVPCSRTLLYYGHSRHLRQSPCKLQKHTLPTPNKTWQDASSQSIWLNWLGPMFLYRKIGVEIEFCSQYNKDTLKQHITHEKGLNRTCGPTCSDEVCWDGDRFVDSGEPCWQTKEETTFECEMDYMMGGEIVSYPFDPVLNKTDIPSEITKVTQLLKHIGATTSKVGEGSVSKLLCRQQ